MSMVDFVHVGPHRTASSKIWEILNNTEEIKLSDKVKETDFFLSDNYEHKIISEFGRSDGRLVGEFGMGYFANLYAGQRIYRHNKNCKIIIGVRNPVERLLSLLQHYYSTGKISSDFEVELVNSPVFIESGRYASHIRWWVRSFGEKNVFLFNYGNFNDNPENEIYRMFKFLGLNEIIFENYNLTQKKGSAEIPRNRILSLMAMKTAHFLRRAGLHQFVNRLRDIGLKRMLAQKKKIVFPNELCNTLNDIYEEDITYLDQHIKDLV